MTFPSNSNISADKTFRAYNPTTGEDIPQIFTESTPAEIEEAVQKAEAAFEIFSRKSGLEKADFLEKIGEEILALGENLLQVCHAETGLPLGRLQGERSRTVNQLKLFSDLLREGSWVQAIIDPAVPDRQPLPKPDIRSMLIPLGPVGIFGASNFPLAFSVAGGDTVSALAAGCTVVVKGHPAHPATSELMGRAIQKAIEKANMPAGVFSLIQGKSTEVGMALVQHPLIKAIGFTGSFRGGKAIYDAAVRRPEPIPVFAEMGSTNPVFILPQALAQKTEGLAQGLVNSVTMGVGQFCTNPGVVFTLTSPETEIFRQKSAEYLAATAAGNMLTQAIKTAYDAGITKLRQIPNVTVIAQGTANQNTCGGNAYLLETSGANILTYPELAEEIFGPSSVLVKVDTKTELLEIARKLEGHLTATLHATPDDLREYADLINILERKVGRLLINGFPTGVEVTHAMVHGGPFPATTDARSTSVGSNAIYRFCRSICYQDFPNQILPAALQNENSLNIFRKVNGKISQEKV